MRLFPVQRHERLLGELRRSGAVRVRELARTLGVSELTIRRDIAALAARDLVTRVHGGATLPSARPRRPAPSSLTIGLVVPSLDLAWPSVIAGARAAAVALGAGLRVRVAGDGRLPPGGEQGLLVAAASNDTLIERSPVPVVLVERQPPRGCPVSWVRTDHALGLDLAVRHLRSRGHRAVGLLLDPGRSAPDGLRRAWPSPTLIPHGATALVVPGAREAVAVADARPDLAIVSYDSAGAADPPLTTVRPAWSQVGRLAVELIVARLRDGDRRPAQGVLVAPELVVRGG